VKRAAVLGTCIAVREIKTDRCVEPTLQYIADVYHATLTYFTSPGCHVLLSFSKRRF